MFVNGKGFAIWSKGERARGEERGRPSSKNKMASPPGVSRHVTTTTCDVIAETMKEVGNINMVTVQDGLVFMDSFPCARLGNLSSINMETCVGWW